MASSSLQQQIASMRQSLFDEGIIDRDRFIQLETMTNPDFVNIAIKAYFEESPKAINDIENALSKSRAALATMQQEYIILKSKLVAYLELLRQAAPTPIFMSNTNPPGQGLAYGND
nr:pseudo histidine-containing phosphotransfer protein 5-like [Quercus suber]POE64154.1 hypothetical protein CFP56_76847 [Quercus suber]